MSNANVLQKAVLELSLPGQVFKVAQGVPIPIEGPPGPPGSGGDLNTKIGVPISNPWVVDHGLGKYPSVYCEDSAGTPVFGTVAYDTLNRVTITFTGLGEFSGFAYFN